MASIGPVSISTGSTPTRHVSTTRARGREPERRRPSRRVISSTAAAPSEICDDVAGGVHAVLAGDRLQRRRAPRARSRGGPRRGRRGGWCRWACRRRRGRARRAATTWVSKRPSAHACAARSWDSQAELVGVGAGDAPLVGDALGALELRRALVAAEVALGDRPADAQLLGDVRADRDPAHRLDAAGDRDVDDARPRRGWWRGWWPAATSRTGCRPWWPRPRAGGRR